MKQNETHELSKEHYNSLISSEGNKKKNKKKPTTTTTTNFEYIISLKADRPTKSNEILAQENMNANDQSLQTTFFYAVFVEFDS